MEGPDAINTGLVRVLKKYIGDVEVQKDEGLH
jgi:hypothetical protein